MNRPNESILYNESDFPMQQRSFAGRQTLNAGRSHRKRTIALCESHCYIRFDELVLRGGRLDSITCWISYTPPSPSKQSRIPHALSSTVMYTLRGKRDSFTLKNSSEVKYILFSFGSRRPQGFFNLKKVSGYQF